MIWRRKRELKSFEEVKKERGIRCPRCEGEVQKKGFRETKRMRVQKYQCKNCGKGFSLKKMLQKSYPTNVILNSISLYNRGMTLGETSKNINKRFGVKTYPKLISLWLKEFSNICTFRRIRGRFVEGTKSGFSDPVFEKLVEHKQPYLYKYHKLKLKLFLADYYSGLKGYLLNVLERCPHELFLKNNLRGSQVKINGLGGNLGSVKIGNIKSYSCLLADLALKMARTNKERHSIVQDFMLCNDTSTIAAEIPVWLTGEEIREINSEIGVFSDVVAGENVSSGGSEAGDVVYDRTRKVEVDNNDNEQADKINNINKTISGQKGESELGVNNEGGGGQVGGEGITGHIDIVQARFGLIYILDYKPEAEKINASKVISQLFTYALALSKRTDVWLRNFRCAWFDNKGYYEFNPNDIVLAALASKFSGKIPEDELKKYVQNEKARKWYTGLDYHAQFKRGMLPQNIEKIMRGEGK